MDGLEKRIAKAVVEAIAKQAEETGDPWHSALANSRHETDGELRIDGVVDLRAVATAILEEIKPAVISMFRVMAQPGIPALTPEQRWDAMIEDRSEEEV